MNMTGMTRKQQPDDMPQRRTQLIRFASYASIMVALSLVALKIWGWQATSSVSLLSSLVDSVLDVFASGVTFLAVRYSLSPADTEHRFGHGKSEGLAALVQAMIITGSGIYVCSEAIQRFLSPQAIEAPEIGLTVIGIATAVTIGLVALQRFVGRTTGSVAIAADALHYQSDILVNIGVALAIALTAWTGWAIVDPLVGLVIALFILRSVIGIGRRALDILLDREIPDDDRARIQQIALIHPDVHGVHDMKTRFGGDHYIVQFHLEMEAAITLLRSHEIMDAVEERVMVSYPGCEIIIHADPLGISERRDPFE
jgi:ferrous-iron efflux pump FieF